VQANHLRRPATVAGHLPNRKGGGVARDYAAVADSLANFLVQRLLQLYVLNDRLNNAVTASERRPIRRWRDAAQDARHVRLTRRGVHFPLGNGFLCQLLDAAFNALHATLQETFLELNCNDIEALLRSGLCDAMAHQSKAYDANCGNTACG